MLGLIAKDSGTDILAGRPPKNAAWPARCAVSLLVGALTLVLMLDQGRAAGCTGHPLEPLDTSSPRATLYNFLKTYDEIGHFIQDTYRNTPSRANWQQYEQMAKRLSVPWT